MVKRNIGEVMVTQLRHIGLVTGVLATLAECHEAEPGAESGVWAVAAGGDREHASLYSDVMTCSTLHHSASLCITIF